MKEFSKDFNSSNFESSNSLGPINIKYEFGKSFKCILNALTSSMIPYLHVDDQQNQI